jgi:transcriptional regulator GlxA family with amidase domain
MRIERDQHRARQLRYTAKRRRSRQTDRRRIPGCPPHFARAFIAETGTTPSKAVEQLRIEVVRQRVQSSSEAIERVAQVTGFRDPERMRRAFIRAFGQPPQSLRRAARAG